MHISSSALSFSSLVLQEQLEALASTSSMSFQALLSAAPEEKPRASCISLPDYTSYQPRGNLAVMVTVWSTT